MLVIFFGMRRVNTQCIQLANKGLLMAAVCYNLKRLLKWMGETELKGGKMLIQHFVCCGHSWCRRAEKADFLWRLATEETSANRRIKRTQNRVLEPSCATATAVVRRPIPRFLNIQRLSG
jgi:hypothetical protein